MSREHWVGKHRLVTPTFHRLETALVALHRFESVKKYFHHGPALARAGPVELARQWE
eukprot:CAMPEP_0204113588 /NCGR_PEP_ID=MMETSP0361-20130328/3743_1 /ASSEMBLY_ACC=CAM_ASM_000343 /TAXON_ID=268821 /ORGANISM="Scrippsiella Hangoei, Strain SHTV-5" /LENGTH=56 /DNA_ID=CAMNT_0051063971 /DNA_START=302 /DNA_END=469 /DNA_ORIENTATION=+